MESIEMIMTPKPTCCTPETSLQDVAKMMIEASCGEIPVVDSMEHLHLIGVITDRDICCRTLGVGLNPMEMKAEDVMTFPAVSVTQSATLEQCQDLMEEKQIRRVPVTDEDQCLMGIISLADIVERSKEMAAEIVQEVSRPSSASFH